MTKEEIVQRIKSSAKYKGLYVKTIKRVVDGSKTEDEARKKLHQMWGAYFGVRPSFHKLAAKVNEKKTAGESDTNINTWLMQLQSSTKERLNGVSDLFGQIQSACPGATTVVDYGCGLNALTSPWWPGGNNWEYMGVDIDQEEIEFLAQVTNFKFLPGDILVDELPKADMYWLFKILPLLDRQQLGSAKEILQKIPAKYVVVTYPTASIGGKNKGMRETYQNQFSELMTELGYEFKSLNGVNELVYVVYKE